jgi:hypothetical protein
MDDVLSVLDEVSEETKVKKNPAKTKVEFSRVNYDNLKKVMKTTKLYAVKNVGDRDLVCDWDLGLMPEELTEEFDKYLSDRYNVYQIKEASLDFRIVVLYRDGRSINFLHQFITEKKLGNLESVQEGPEVVVKSQFVLPVGETAIVTEKQYDSLKRYEKKRVKTATGLSDWDGILVFKELDEDNLKKVAHSFVTVQDIKNNEFEVDQGQLKVARGSATMEYSDELNEL